MFGNGQFTHCFLIFTVLIPTVQNVYVLQTTQEKSNLSAVDLKSEPKSALIRRTRPGIPTRSRRWMRNQTGSIGSSSKPVYCPINYSAIPNNRPLLCYQCQGEAREKDSICDNTLWHFARKAEQYNVRIRCPNNRGFYCVKMIQEKAGMRLTQRGCLGQGPIRTLADNRTVPLNEGCVVYEQNGFITTSCLCRKDLCNSANIQLVWFELLFLPITTFGLYSSKFYISLILT